MQRGCDTLTAFTTLRRQLSTLSFLVRFFANCSQLVVAVHHRNPTQRIQLHNVGYLASRLAGVRVILQRFDHIAARLENPAYVALQERFMDNPVKARRKALVGGGAD